MKKLFGLVFVLVAAFALVSCVDPEKPVDYSKSEGVMTYAEYMAAELDQEVVVEVFVQATQSWWDNKITVYAADPDGAYFIYEMACSEEDAAKLTAGTYIKVSGVKGEYRGEVEILDATFEFAKDIKYVATVFDATSLLGTDDMIKHQNELVSFKGLTVCASFKADDTTEYAWLYKWDGSGSEGSDLYFNLKDAAGKVYTFTVESYLCGAETEVYKAVKELKVGDVVDVECFAYWYDSLNPHVTKVVVK